MGQLTKFNTENEDLGYAMTKMKVLCEWIKNACHLIVIMAYPCQRKEKLLNDWNLEVHIVIWREKNGRSILSYIKFLGLSP